MNKNVENSNETQNPKLGISAVSCSVCGEVVKISIGHSITWSGIYDIKRCKCGTWMDKKHYN
jgi:hypothetical protein